MKKNRFFLMSFAFVASLVLAFVAGADETNAITITGTVTNEQGTPLEGAMVTMLNSTDSGVKTDAEGNYTIASVPEATMTVSLDGYETADFVVVADSSVYNVKLKEVPAEVVTEEAEVIEE